MTPTATQNRRPAFPGGPLVGLDAARRAKMVLWIQRHARSLATRAVRDRATQARLARQAERFGARAATEQAAADALTAWLRRQEGGRADA